MAREIDAIMQLYDYILRIISNPEKFPRSQKNMLGDRIKKKRDDCWAQSIATGNRSFVKAVKSLKGWLKTGQ